MRSTIILEGGDRVAVKGHPEEVEKKIAAGPKDTTYYEYVEGAEPQRLYYTYVEPAFITFEHADGRRPIRLRSTMIVGVLGQGS